ncbi:EamA family transporter [Roseateles sp. DB2]|uniref:EamA family transporter n=1 Tax=Roseateles sp. DB2 TaxID=3453717 RepID=UPI003EEC895A
MPTTALLLVLAAALCHASWNLIAKRNGGGSEFVLISAVLVGLVWAPVAVWQGWDALPHFGRTEWAALAGSTVLHIVYFRSLLHGYRVSDLTVVYPVARGSGPLLSTAGAVLLLGESLSLAGGLGALAVVGGVFLIAGGPTLLRQAHEPGAKERVLRGLRWGALTGACIAGYTVLDGYAVKVLLISPVVLDYMGNVLRIPVMLPLALRKPAAFRSAWRQQWRAALAVAVLGPASYVMVLYAMRLAPLSHVAPARELSMLFAALAGGSLLGEGDRALRLLGAAFIALGVMGLALG